MTFPGKARMARKQKLKVGAGWLVHSGVVTTPRRDEVVPMKYPNRFSWSSVAVACACAAFIAVYIWFLVKTYLVGWAE